MSNSEVNLELLYAAIVAGKSFSQIKIEDNLIDIYYRHPSHSELFELERDKDKFRAELPPDLLTEQEALELAINEGWWPREKEERLILEQNFIKRIEQTEQIMDRERDKKEQRELKKPHQKIVDELLEERNSLMPPRTVETLVARYINELCLVKFFYSDSSLTTPLFDQENYDDLPDLTINLLQLEYYNLLSVFSYENIRKLASGAFFQNLLHVSGDIAQNFFGIPTVKLTKYQYELFLSGRHFKTILTNCGQIDKSIPPEKMGNPEEMEKWHDLQIKAYNNKNQKGYQNDSNGRGGSSMVGASQEENRAIHGKEANNGGLLSRAKKAGGKLSLVGGNI